MTGPRFYDHSDKPHFVYRCFDGAGRLVYVGCTVDPAGRIATHQTSSWWFHEVASTRFTVFPDKRYALAKEREAIGEEQPRFNKKGRWRHRALWTADDYRDYHLTIVMSGNAGTSFNQSHVQKVEREARQRYGIDLTSEVAS